ncbi:hypothetical protein G6F22_014590 [Rhizopus arrhizus]|nr:hypothetical protein G6F22_014590 [Rhizopus arrhizus]
MRTSTRAAVGRFEAPGPVGDRAGERALGVAEQFAFRQGLRQGGAVHVHQRLAAATRQAVHAMREQLLADAGFAQQQDRQVGIGHHLDLVQQPGDGRAVAQDFVPVRRHAVGGGGAAGVAQGADLGLQPRGAQRGFDQHDGVAQFGLRLPVEGADIQRIQRQHAPGFAFDVQAGAHAVVYRQRLAGHAVDQAVIGIGKRAVVVETGDAAPGQDGGQARGGGV